MASPMCFSDRIAVLGWASGSSAMQERGQIGAAYDSIAEDYDEHLARDGWVRRILWQHFERVFRSGDRIVDVGCGTGIDAVHLASQGIRVTALDVSPKMVAQMRAKLARSSLTSMVDVQVGDVIDLAAGLEGSFAGIISSFAALNTVDLSAFSEVAGRLLSSQGRLICHMLSPGHFSRRTMSTAGERAVHIGGETVRHHSLTADEVYRRFFAANFVVREVYGLGLVLRGPIQRGIPERLLPFLGRIDRRLGSVPVLVSMGRFFVLDLERR